MTQGRQLQLEWSERQGRGCLRVSGWTETELSELGRLGSDGLGRRLTLLPSEVLEASDDYRAMPPVAGSFTLEQSSVCFIPRFPFPDGMRYSLLVDRGPGDPSRKDPEVWTIRRPGGETGTPDTEVAAIYPTAAELPVNLLRFYVHFSGPMSEGWAARAVTVRRQDTGEPLEGVFLPMEPELWDPGRRRLTLLLDPGRIKRGLAPNLEAGYPLIEGVPVEIAIALAFRDAAGRPLTNGAERRYRIGPPVRARIQPDCWQWHIPSPGSMDSLSVAFDRPLDHALLGHCLWVADAAGSAMPGQGIIGPGERSWRFIPEHPWGKNGYQLVIEPTLEDVAGNSAARVFDRDVTKLEDTPSEAKRVAIHFSCVP